jgi:ABC-type transport system substrate-binding protein
MIDKKLFQEKTIQEKIKISFLSISQEKAFYLGLYFMVLFFTLSFLGFYLLSKKTSSVPAYNTKLNISTTDPIVYTLPIYAKNNTEKFLSSILYSGLKKKNIGGIYENDIAEYVTKDDSEKNIYNIKIKNNAKFSNGENITSDDIMYSYSLQSDIVIDSIDRVKYEGMAFEKIDDRNLRIIFEKNFSEIDNIFTLGIVSKKDMETEKRDGLHLSVKSLQSVSSGPYKISIVTKDDSSVSELFFIKNNYYIESPHNKYIDLKIFKNANELETFEKDSAWSDLVLGSVNNLTDFKSVSYATPKITALFFNPNKNTAFAKKEIRESVYKSVNRLNLIDKLKLDASETYSILPDNNIQSTYNSTTTATDFSTTTLNITVPESKQNNLLSQEIKTELESYGYVVNIKSVSTEEVANNTIKNRDFEILLYTIEIDTPTTLYAFWHSSQRNAPGLNITGYNSKTFDENLENIKKSTSTENIANYLVDIEKEFFREYPYIPLYSINKNILTRNDQNLNIDIPSKIYNQKDIGANIVNWYKDKEKIWPVIQKYNTQVEKIYKLIH